MILILFSWLGMIVMAICIHAANSDYVWLKREVINGNGRCRYLTRWHLAKFRGWSAYLHWFTGDDWSIDKHDHPRPFWSIGLWGSYVEHTERRLDDGSVQDEWAYWGAPWVRRFPPSHTHRLLLLPLGHEKKRPCLTLVIVGPLERSWGWWIPEHLWHHFAGKMQAVKRVVGKGAVGWVPWDEYVFHTGVADARKSCP